MTGILAAESSEFAVYEVGKVHRPGSTCKIQPVGHSPEPGLAAWLSSLAKSVAIVACNDVCGSHVLRCCLENGIRVPDDVAVIGVGKDETICDLAQPALSSVANNTQLIGYRVAETLDHLLGSVKTIPKIELVRPIGVVTRLSTDATIVSDPSVGEALRFIRDFACRGISVSGIARRAANNAWRSLEQPPNDGFERRPVAPSAMKSEKYVWRERANCWPRRTKNWLPWQSWPVSVAPNTRPRLSKRPSASRRASIGWCISRNEGRRAALRSAPRRDRLIGSDRRDCTGAPKPSAASFPHAAAKV